MPITILTGFLILSGAALIILGILVSTGVLKTSNNSPITSTSSPKPPYIISPPPPPQTQPPLITHTPFKTGYMTNLPPHKKLEDNCNSVMYQINPLYVNYGTPRSRDSCCGECDVNIFNDAP